MPVEFDCEGCGVHVVALGIVRRDGVRWARPAHGFCAICEWLNDFIWKNYWNGLKEFWELYEHSGLNDNAPPRRWRTPA